LNKKYLPYFIDFEASSLGPNSYPIEVAFGHEGAKVENYLIDPSSISHWSDWDHFAESVHKISKEQLRRDGLQPKVIAEIMNERLEGTVLYSDVQEYDWMWCQKLYDSVGVTPSFKISDARILFKHTLHANREPSLTEIMTESTLSDEQLITTLDDYSSKAWRNLDCAPHRAASDVKHLIEMWKLINGIA
jgi:hypothetical protein